MEKILSFLHEAEKLKTVLRHAWLTSGRRESVAEHTWRMTLMALVMHEYLEHKVDVLKVLKIIIVHDLAEIYVPDYVAFKKQPAGKAAAEERAIKKLSKMLPTRVGAEVRALWREYEDNTTTEAHFAKALDKIEVMLQHNESDIKTQLKSEIPFNLVHGNAHCEYDSFLKEFRALVKKETLKYYKKNKVDKKLYVK